MFNRPLLATLLFALATGSVLAQDVKLYRATDSVDPRDVAAILDTKPIKMRSIRLLDDAPAAQQAAYTPQQVASAAEPAAAAPQRPRPSALALPVQFAFDSFEIQPAARAQLDALAEGIRLLPENKSVLIEGHTDASGADHYNEELSKMRAFSVKRYLVTQHGINPSRLRAVGMGEYATLAGLDPLASENRRVQFRGE